MRKTCSYIFLSIILLGYLFFQFRPSMKGPPPIQADEAMLASMTLCLIENIPFPGDITLGGRHILLGRGHHGAVENYILLPFILLGGSTLEALRTGTIIFGFFIVLFIYWVGAKFFNKTVGIIAAFLLTFNTFFYRI